MQVPGSVSWRRPMRWLLGGLFCPLACLTIILFCFTGRPLARGFLAWSPGEYLGFRGRTHDERHALSLMRGASFDPQALYLIRDVETWSPRAQVELPSPWDVLVSPTGSLLSIASRTKKSGFDFYSIPPGRLVGEIMPQWSTPGGRELLAMSRDGKLALIAHDRDPVQLWDLDSFKHLRTVETGYRKVIACFFDAEDKPKVLCYDFPIEPVAGKLECWDVSTKSTVCFFADSETASTRYHRVSNDASTLIMEIDSQTFGVWSVKDGQLRRRLRLGTRPADISIAPEGRFVAVRFEEKPTGFNDWLYEHCPSILQGLRKMPAADPFLMREPGSLHEIATGKQWKFPSCAYGPVVASGSTCITFDRQGRYEYDLPPRWRYFTPWAWAALGAWLAVGGGWWYLGRRTARPAPP